MSGAPNEERPSRLARWNEEKGRYVELTDDGGNGRVTTRALYRAIDDTKEILLAELARVHDRIAQNEQKLEAICKRLNAKPGRTWMGARLTQTIDRMIPLGVVALITWLLTRSAV